MKITLNIDNHDAGLLYRALLSHDGPSLAPDLARVDQALLTRALDCLRLELMEHAGKDER